MTSPQTLSIGFPGDWLSSHQCDKPLSHSHRPHPGISLSLGEAAALSCGLEGTGLPESSEVSGSRASWMVGGERVGVRCTQKPGKGRCAAVRLKDS